MVKGFVRTRRRRFRSASCHHGSRQMPRGEAAASLSASRHPRWHLDTPELQDE